jgi:hypothetical protein|tara:strand:+ start:2390 stop:2572 length:183 start_codon:yes stop_codon:yes gene_type:complete
MEGDSRMQKETIHVYLGGGSSSNIMDILKQTRLEWLPFSGSIRKFDEPDKTMRINNFSNT